MRVPSILRRRKYEVDTTEVQSALAATQAAEERSEEREIEVALVVKELRTMRRRNNFSERLRPTFGGHS